MTVKVKTIWYCQECGNKQLKWAGQCSLCKKWNTLQEEKEVKESTERFTAKPKERARPKKLKEISENEIPRIKTEVKEIDRLLGGGIVPGSLSLIGGDPGIGKSTLMLQLSNALARQGLTILYVCGEESTEQTAMRARRLGIQADNLLLLSETNMTHILNEIEQIQPDLVIIDSIQIVYKSDVSSSPGSVSQVREVATECMHLAKGKEVAIFLIGHVTKSGEIAGPRVLEHLVDTVLYFEGDKQHNYRMIRSIKNRFGPTDEIAVFQMQSRGLAEVPNPSQIFLEERMRQAAGSAIIPILEGTRTLLIEAQALVTETAYSTPSRRCSGISPNRLQLLLAVMEKKLQYQMFKCDVFVSITGGMQITETAADLGIIAAITSSMRNKPIDAETVMIGEVGLSGEVRSVPRITGRIKEAIQLGFTRCIIPKRNLKGLPEELKQKCAIVGVETVNQAIDALF